MPTEIDRYEALAVDSGRRGHRHRREGETRQLCWWTYAGQIPTLPVLGIGPRPLIPRWSGSSIGSSPGDTFAAGFEK